MTDILKLSDGKIALHDGKIVLLDQSTQDAMEDCCCPPPPGGYRLAVCDVDCDSDCDGVGSPIYTSPAYSDLVPSDIGKSVKISGSTKCWSVGYWPSAGSTSVSVTARYSGCNSGDNPCCDVCYTCGDCDFHADSYIIYTEMNWSCAYLNPNCADYDEHNIHYVPPCVLVKTDCNVWSAVVPKYADNVDLGDCHIPTQSELDALTYIGVTGVTVSYNCGTNLWSASPSYTFNLCGANSSGCGGGGGTYYFGCNSPNNYIYGGTCSFSVEANECGAP